MGTASKSNASTARKKDFSSETILFQLGTHAWEIGMKTWP
jgi:hypothetical protein